MKLKPPHRPQPVPVIMLHSVGAGYLNWPYAYLSEDLALFELKIDFLIRSGHSFIFHHDLYLYMAQGIPLPPGSLMLTFDDGYLDNWTVVFPLLKKRGIRFTVYVSQEFIDPEPVCRPTLEDVWARRCSQAELPLLGYLSWSEMKAMESSGLVDIQSHTSTHTWHFTNNRVIDFIHPANTDLYPWMMWNHHPENKYRWMLDNADAGPWGIPVYENKRAMVATRYHEDPDLNTMLREYVLVNGNTAFFTTSGWREKLQKLVDEFQTRESYTGRFESEVEHYERLRYELEGNKAAIEIALDKEVRYLCWPGGAYNDGLIQIASESGYRASTVKLGNNTFGDDPRFVHRIPSGNPDGAHKFPWKYPLFTLRFYLDRFHKKTWAVALDWAYRRNAYK